MNWKVSDEHNIISIIADGATLCQMSRHRTKGSVLIDARLIAAAPDLLEALQELYHLIDSTHDGERVFTTEMQKKAKAAIAKAKGE